MALCTETCTAEAKAVHTPVGYDGTYWQVPVDSLDDISQPSRDNAYILPGNSVWVLNHDGDDYVQISSEGTDEQATLISNSDGYITISGSGTHSVVIDLNEKALSGITSDIGTVNNAVNYSGDTVLPGGLKVCWGYVTAPASSAAGSVSSIVVTFPFSFDYLPNVQVTGNTATPGTGLIEVSYANLTTSGVTVYKTRADTSSQGVSWFAIGF